MGCWYETVLHHVCTCVCGQVEQLADPLAKNFVVEFTWRPETMSSFFDSASSSTSSAMVKIEYEVRCLSHNTNRSLVRCTFMAMVGEQTSPSLPSAYTVLYRHACHARVCVCVCVLPLIFEVTSRRPLQAVSN